MNGYDQGGNGELPVLDPQPTPPTEHKFEISLDIRGVPEVRAWLNGTGADALRFRYLTCQLTSESARLERKSILTLMANGEGTLESVCRTIDEAMRSLTPEDFGGSADKPS